MFLTAFISTANNRFNVAASLEDQTGHSNSRISSVLTSAGKLWVSCLLLKSGRPYLYSQVFFCLTCL